MTSVDSKTRGLIQNLDRISGLPEPIILDILSRLPLEDSARASILSKTWKSYCALDPILYYDHNVFALQSMIGGGEPDINQIRDAFLDNVHHQLSRATQLDSPIRKLALNVAINDTKCFSRLDTCLELVRHMNVQDLCVIVQTVECFWKQIFFDVDDIYEFPISMLGSKGLRSVYIRGCMFAEETFVGDPINKREVVSFSSLQRLCLSHVYIKDHVFDNLVNYCPGIEMLVFDCCTVGLKKSMDLSRFPKLKNAVIEFQRGFIDHVGIVGTNLECFKCTINIVTGCHISPAACAGIRVLVLMGFTINQPLVFADIAGAFPLVEEAKLFIHDTETVKAVSKVLRKLELQRFFGFAPVKEVHIDCPSLTFLDCFGYDLVHLYIDCPKLRVFHYCGNLVPKQFFFSPVADLEECSFKISCNDVLRLISVRALLVNFMANPTYVRLAFTFPLATFEPEQVEAFHPPPQYNVHLTIIVTCEVGQNVAALVDAALWVIRPTTLRVASGFYHVLKYLCENLIKKSQVNICDEQVTYPCWMHQLEDFQVESSLDIPDIKENLDTLAEQCQEYLDNLENLYTLAERCQIPEEHIYFIFRWSNE